MVSSLAIFEDDLWTNFAPLSLTRALFDIKVGSKTIFESYQDRPRYLLARRLVQEITAERHIGVEVNPSKIDTDAIFVNALAMPSSSDLSNYEKTSGTFAVVDKDRLIAARLSTRDIDIVTRSAADGKRVPTKSLMVDRIISQNESRSAPRILLQPWEIIRDIEHWLDAQIHPLVCDPPSKDFELYKTRSSTKSLGITILGEHGALVSRSAMLEEGTVLDCSKGPVCIEGDAKVSQSRIVGPTFIAEGAQVKQFTIVASSYVGKKCRIAGEVEDSIVCEFSNKAHTGFLGHSFVGSWINIGAMTTTSDLKMTYGDIKILTGGKKTNTGMNKLGSFFGDMVKTSIGCLIYSGNRIGVSSHLHGLVSGDIPSFTIAGKGIGSPDVELRLDSAIETQRKMMSRRGVIMSMAFEKMITDIFRLTAPERKNSRVRKARFVSP